MTTPLDRRSLFRSTAATIAAGAIAGGLLSTEAASAAADADSSLTQGTRILFQGDSITDAGRNRKRVNANDPKGIGGGYPRFIASELLLEYPTKKLKLYNRGVSGNKVPDLAARWQKDCYDLKPDVLSILVGVNDIWHKLNGRYDGTVQTYESGYRQLLKETSENLPDVRIIICEPFVLRCGAVDDKWFPEFTKRLEVARQIASDLSLERIAFQDMFDEAIKVAPPKYWAGDGVHPTLAGHALMAKTWRQTIGI